MHHRYRLLTQNFLLSVTVAALALTCFQAEALGQAGGGPVIPPVVLPPTPPGQGPVAPPAGAPGGVPAAPGGQPAGLPGGGGGGGGGAQPSDGQLDTIEPSEITLQIPDNRNQGFVGNTGQTQANQGFTGTAGINSGIALADEPRGTEGGTVNDGLGVRTVTPPQPPQRFGFSVPRQSIRARLVPSFATAPTPAFASTIRFDSRIRRQPVVRQLGRNITVSIGNGTATLRGVASSDAERQILIRQLRLEPGVYRISDLSTTVQ